ncbi:MAG: hypothetical protein JWM43_1750 [Acidobacteriaceae bacterium]|nr:hypothetical protein [Acidobacteriaceae bacterium]
MAALALLFGSSVGAFAQATPTATAGPAVYSPGPMLPLMDGNFQYSLTGSEIVQFGNSYSGGGGTSSSSISSVSGNMQYTNSSSSHPFSMIYSGGVLFSNYSGRGVSTFQSVSASQGLIKGRWAMGVSDTLSFLPQTGTTGISGIPGVGDLGVSPILDPLAPNQTVLSNYGRQINNSVSGNISRQLTGRTSISGTGSYGILRFIDGVGFSSDQVSGQVGINHQLDRRSSIGLNAQYSAYSYGINSTSFQSRGLNLTYSRTLTKELSVQGSAGPQWTNSFLSLPIAGSGITTPVLVPSRLGLSASASLLYMHHHFNSSVIYSRGVNSGSGLQIGSVADTLSGQVGRGWGRDWSGSLSMSYARTTGLALPGTFTSVYGGAQVTRRLGQKFSAYMSYTAIQQSTPNSLLGLNAYNGLTHSIGVGVTFAPRRTRLNQF